MNLIACVAFVPDTATKIVIGGDGKSINETDVKYILSPYDEYGLEEALKVKESQGGTLTVISAGPERTQQGLREALARGADDAVHIDTGDGVLDSNAVAELLAAQIRTMPHDLVFFGKMGVGGDHAQTFAIVAEKLDVPHVSVVIKMEVKDGMIHAEREIEGGHEVVEAPLPCVIAAQKGLNEPRYASLKGIMAAKKKPITVRKPADLGVDPASAIRTVVAKLELPPPRPAAKILTGDPAEAAKELARLLREEAKVI